MIVDVKPHTPAWSAWRAQGIGGSDAGVITGDDPFRSAMSLWLEKSGYLERDPDDTDEPRYWGRVLEPAVIDRFERDTGLFVHSRQLCMQHDVDAWRRATIDGLVHEVLERTPFNAPEPAVLPGGVLGLFEGKTTSKYREWEDGPPVHVQLQAQHNMDVAGVDAAWVAVLFTAPIVHFATFELARDESVLEPLREMEARFWRRVLEGDAPPAASADLADLKRAYEDSVADSIELPPVGAALVLELAAAREDHKYSEQRVDAIQARLAALLREHEVGIIGGQRAIEWRRHEKTYVDVDGLRAANPELVAKFTTKRPYRQFTIPKRLVPLVAAELEEGESDVDDLITVR